MLPVYQHIITSWTWPRPHTKKCILTHRPTLKLAARKLAPAFITPQPIPLITRKPTAIRLPKSELNKKKKNSQRTERTNKIPPLNAFFSHHKSQSRALHTQLISPAYIENRARDYNSLGCRTSGNCREPVFLTLARSLARARGCSPDDDNFPRAERLSPPRVL